MIVLQKSLDIKITINGQINIFVRKWVNRQMKYLLIYYTGTHNTRFLVNQLKTRLEIDSHKVQTVEIKWDTPIIDINGYDYVGLAYPIYGFNAPKPFNKYLRKLKFNKDQKYFIFKNSGEVLAVNNASSRVPKRIMRHKKCLFKGEYHFVMPYNIHFRFPVEFVKEAMEYNKKLFEIMLNNLNYNIIFYPKSNLIYEIASFLVSIQKIGGNINSFFYKVDDNKCSKCGLCIKNCPHNNIYFKNDKIKFSHHCDMCMACSFFCPNDAIKIGFLEGWHVNGDYHLKEIENSPRNDKSFINKDSQGFYKCFIKYFEMIDKMYDDIKK